MIDSDLRTGLGKALIDNGDGTFSMRATIPSVTLTTGDIEIGAVEIKNATDDTRAVVGANGLYVDVRASVGLTDTQLRATAVPVSGPLTDTQLRATAVPVSGALTDTELRATAVPVTANAGTNLNTSLLALEAGGNLAAAAASLAALDNIVAGSEAQVDVVTSALPTGAATEATLGTIDTDTGNIATNTTDIPSVIGTDGLAGPAKVLSMGGTQATGELQELQVDADGQLQVDVLSLPAVTGSVTANAGTNLNTSLLALEAGGNLAAAAASLATLDNIVAGAEAQVDVVTSALPTGASTEATLATLALETGGNLAGAATSLAVMDDWDNAASDGASVSGDVAHDGADAGEPVKVGYKAYAFDGTAPQAAVAEADRVNAIADLQGIQFVQTSHPAFWHATADYGAAQTNASVKTAPGAGSLYITDIFLSNGATAGNVTLLDGSGGTVLWEAYPGINGGAVCNLRNPIKLTATTALCLTSTTVTTHSVTICGFTA